MSKTDPATSTAPSRQNPSPDQEGVPSGLVRPRRWWPSHGTWNALTVATVGAVAGGTVILGAEWLVTHI